MRLPPICAINVAFSITKTAITGASKANLLNDTVLLKVALAMRKRFKRPDDYCFRLGGEEFGILFYAHSKEDALEITMCLKQDIEDLQIVHENSIVSSHLTVSAGLYTIDNQNDTQESLYKRSDEVLYQAKEAGRNSIVVYTNETDR